MIAEIGATANFTGRIGDAVRSLTSRLETVGSSSFFLAVQRGLLLSLPLILSGAFALCLLYAPVPGLRETLDVLFGSSWRTVCETLVNATFGIASLTVLCGMAHSFAQVFNVKNPGKYVSPSMNMVIVLSCFFLLIGPPQDTSWALAFSHSHGLLAAIFTATTASALFIHLASRRGLQLPLTASSRSAITFDAFLPLPAGILTILIFGISVAAFETAMPAQIGQTLNAAVLSVFSNAGHGLELGMLYSALCQVLWFFGIHGPNFLFGLEESILTPAIIENIAHAQQGLEPPNIVTKSFLDTFCRIGGSGSTLCLIAAILYKSNDSGIRKLAILALFPAMLNVNEPIVYSIPLVFNPIFVIPFVLTPVVQTLTAYAATALDFVPRTISVVHWTTTPLIGGYEATGSMAGVVMQMVNIAIGVALYAPFVKLAEAINKNQHAAAIKGLCDAANANHPGPTGMKCLNRPGFEGHMARTLAHDLTEALSTGTQLFVVYQPQINTETDTVVGVEALLRWQHPVFGMIPPPVAIAIAEDTGTVDGLSHFILETSCNQYRAWKEIVDEGFVMSVNLSPKQFADEHLADKVFKVLDRIDMAPDKLALEITESVATAPSDQTLATLDQLRSRGVKVAIDDFGMGHTSLRYLNQFPIDTVKIDRSLSQASADGVNAHIVSSIVGLGRALSIKVVVEGVETNVQLDWLNSLGCHLFQGYLLSKPLSEDDCFRFLVQNRSTVSPFPDSGKSRPRLRLCS